MKSLALPFLLLLILLVPFFPEKGLSQTYEFDEGMKVLTAGLIAKKEDFLKSKKIAVFGIVESKTSEPWEITSHIEDGIVDALVNEGFTVVERRRIEDVIKKEIKKTTDIWFDEAQVAQFGKLVGADLVVTGRFALWGKNILRINIRGINVADGKVLAASKVNVHTDRIEELLTPEKSFAKKEEEPKKDQSVGKGATKKDSGDKPSQQGPTTPKQPSQELPPYQQQPTYPQQPPYQQQPYQQPYPYQPQDQYSPPAYPPAAEYVWFCCDQFGVRRCQLIQPVPMGSPCFCPGQGWGYACP